MDIKLSRKNYRSTQTSVRKTDKHIEEILPSKKKIWMTTSISNETVQLKEINLLDQRNFH